MSIRTRRTARTLGIAVLTAAGVAAGNLASAQVGGFTPTNPPARTYLPPRQPGTNPPARPPSQGTVQAGTSLSSTPLPFAAANTFPPSFNPGFLTLDSPPDPPPGAALAPRPSGSGFQFNPGWGIGPAGGFGQGPPPDSLLPGQQVGWPGAALKPVGEMVVEWDGSRFYRMAGSELFYSPAARTYLNPQTGVVSRPSMMGLAAVR
jgi:hypothetical protein